MSPEEVEKKAARLMEPSWAKTMLIRSSPRFGASKRCPTFVNSPVFDGCVTPPL
jgi:hypothetical protein